MSNWVDFKQIREQISLKEVLLTYYGITNLKQKGSKLIGPCPVHGGKGHRSFHADLEKNAWFCFSGCKSGGNQIDLVAKTENIPIREAALKLKSFFLGQDSNKQSLPSSPQELPAKPQKPKADCLDSSKGEKGKAKHNEPINVNIKLYHDYPYLLENRALMLDTCKYFDVGYCKRGIMRGCVALPVHNEDGELIAYAGRRLKVADIEKYGKYKLPNNFHKSIVLYNYHRAKELMNTQGLILVEGFFKLFNLFEAGFANVVSTMGSSASDYQLDLLSRAKELVILFDGDKAGCDGAYAIRDKLAGKLPIRIAHLPQGTEPDDLTGEQLSWLINGLQSFELEELSFQFEKAV